MTDTRSTPEREPLVRPATPTENMRILLSRLSAYLSPAEKRELEQAAASLTGLPVKCGENASVPIAETGGCGIAIHESKDVYRCAGCGIAFHRTCLKGHFGKDGCARSADGELKPSDGAIAWAKITEKLSYKCSARELDAAQFILAFIERGYAHSASERTRDVGMINEATGTGSATGAAGCLPYYVNDGFGNGWECRRGLPSGNCGLEVVRPGKVQCGRCDNVTDSPTDRKAHP